MDKIKAVIIDDVVDAIQVLEQELKDSIPQVMVVGKARGVVEASKLLRQVKADLLFLDIDLGDGTGFDLLEILSDLSFKVIFTTASEAHAVKAFRFAAIDYLVKPIDRKDLQEAVSRAMSFNKNEGEIEVLLNAWTNQQKVDKIVLSNADQSEIVEIKEIIRCEASNNYTMFFISGRSKVLVSKTLKYYDQLLSDYGFFRCHQSHLVNLQHIIRFVKQDGGYLQMNDGTMVPVSSRKRATLLETLDRL